MKVRDLLTDELNWCQRHYAKNRFGQCVAIHSADACRWCLSAAINKCYPAKSNERLDVRSRVCAEIGVDIAIWNDWAGRTFAEVRALIEELDI